MKSSLENSALSNHVWSVDIESGIVSCEDLPYRFKFTVREYTEEGEACKLSSNYHMKSRNIYLHKENDEVYLMMRLAGKAFLDAVNESRAGEEQGLY